MEKKGHDGGKDWVKMGMIGKNRGQDGKKWEKREINGKPMGQRPMGKKNGKGAKGEERGRKWEGYGVKWKRRDRK
jgi:hypothetical protein